MKKRSIAAIMAILVMLATVCLTGCGGNSSEETVVIAGSTSVQPITEAIAEEYMKEHPDVAVEVQGGGSGQGIKSISEGIADIGALSRDVKDEEKSEIGQEFVIAKDGIAIVVNKEVTIDELTLEQVRQIYAGEITNWKELGGKDERITVVTREAGSGTRGAFTELVGVFTVDEEGNELDCIVKSALVQPSTGAIKETVSKTPGTIGYISVGILDENVKAVKIDGVSPSIETVLSGEYQLQRPFVYVIGDATSEAAKAFIDYVLGEEGQHIIEENGFVPVEK